MPLPKLRRVPKKGPITNFVENFTFFGTIFIVIGLLIGGFFLIVKTFAWLIINSII